MDRQYRKIKENEKQNLRPYLENIWKKCFFDTDEGTNFVFENIYPSSRCYCCFTDEICCASLYLIDGEIEDKRGILQKTHYLFGAATLPEYRKGGIMSALIEYALMDSFKDGDKASILLPANEGLYSYYEKLGYSPLYGTAIKEFDLLNFKEDRKDSQNFQNVEKINRIIDLRKNAKQPVSVMQFPDETVKNALGYNEVYKGYTACGEDYYMVIQSDGENAVATEFISKRPPEEILKRNIPELENIKKLTVRIPSASEKKFGMIRVLDEGTEFPREIYIGLTKD